MKRFHNSRLFISAITKPPIPEDAAYRPFPFVDTWNAREGRRGMARVDILCEQGEFDTYFNIIESCGQITHWRWAEGGK